MNMGAEARLDAFTDAAFAFAVSLLVIGGAGAPADFAGLTRALADVPAFAFGFAIVTMYWLAHVRWRRLRGTGTWRSTTLTLLLVFLALIFVQPLRSMAAATGQWFTGQGAGFRGSLPGLFAVYGTGFTAMSLTVAALYADALRDPDLAAPGRRAALGERWIWLILSATGLVSIAASLTRWGHWAAMVYATLPVTVGLFTARWRWADGD